MAEQLEQFEKAIPPLTQRVSRYILDQALAGGYENGRHMTEADLAGRLGISRTPVRAALRFLHERALLAHVPNRGYTLVADREALGRARREMPEDEEKTLYYRLLRDRLAGKLPTRVNELELAQTYAVPRPLLRTVLTTLLQDGVLRGRHYQRWEFTETLDSVESERESYRFRLTVECAGLREPGFQVDLQRLLACRERQQGLLVHASRYSWMDFFEANAQFHELLASASGNRFFLDAVQQQNRLRRMSDLSDYPLVNIDLLHKSCHEHLEILDAVERNDLATAAEHMRLHLSRASDLLERRVQGVLGD
ncbi:GntR family transcriptional regulator [Variovorax sp. J22G73]|jgi:DNA-binding GntR family transcriptional regulator|uniref:GntR family transcriptional regulator n=1 Tax=unclassified Variovorax TaxID=663243 RepID=UPI000D5D6957|nr:MULTISPECIES: GntR family transcriptional regulator [unclassified Variovorax]MDM0006048.1 GntR family transcriptional regulator [Variovorax sp. J22R203]MDM0097928.1 GntR family transcriptional regulator [Variovorax sp. J22G73]